MEKSRIEHEVERLRQELAEALGDPEAEVAWLEAAGQDGSTGFGYLGSRASLTPFVQVIDRWLIVSELAYDPAADAVFNRTGVDVYFMEYDSERAGGLEPLRLLPKGNKRVMPGFITTKTGDLESIDDLRRRFDEAAKYADLDQLGIAPQCGFASTEEGNVITPDDQRRKLELVVRTAEAIWGGVEQ